MRASGTVVIRPPRIALTGPPTPNVIRRAVGLACTSWGGAYSPMISALSPDPEKRAIAYNSDVLHSLSAEESQTRAKPGLSWAGYRDTPYTGSSDNLITRTLDVTWLDDPSLSTVDHVWTDDDPLAPLFEVWYGRFPTDEEGERVATAFRQRSTVLNIGDDACPPEAAAGDSPVTFTQRLTTIAQRYIEASIAVVDVTNPSHLMSFWNARAAGMDIYPYPPFYRARVLPGLLRWLRNQPKSKDTSRHPLAPPMAVMVPDELFDGFDGDQELRGIIASTGRKMFVSGYVDPIEHIDVTTTFTQFFDYTSHGGNDTHVDIALPRPSFLPQGRRFPGHVAADISFHGLDDLPSGATVLGSSVRASGDILRRVLQYQPPFQHFTPDGVVVGVQAHELRLRLPLMRSIAVFQDLVPSSWTFGQSHNGRFISRLTKRLGGPHSEMASQPAVRAVLAKAGQTTNSEPIPALIQCAENRQGEWPDLLHGFETRRDYATHVVNQLIYEQLLRPVAPIRCPSCSLKVDMTPEELATTLKCEMCGETYPLGLALSLERTRQRWQYRLAEKISAPLLTEALAIMATVAVLAQQGRNRGIERAYMPGLSVEQLGGREVDIALLLDDYGIPSVIVGEVKSFRDDIDKNDIELLARLQREFRSAGIEAYVAVATLRESLSAGERGVIEDMIQSEPLTPLYRTSHGADIVYPIALVERDLSLPWLNEDHPLRRTTRFGLGALAYDTYSRNVASGGQTS